MTDTHEIPNVRARLDALKREYTDPTTNEIHYGAMTAEAGFMALEREVDHAVDFFRERTAAGGLSASDQRASDRTAAAFGALMACKEEAIDENRRSLHERRERADAAGRVVNFTTPDTHRRDGARGIAIGNIERSRARDDVKQRIIEAVEADADVADTVAVRSNPDYLSAWLKWMRDPQMGHLEWNPSERAAWTAVKEETRAAMLESGTAAAGVPSILDPAWVITGAGIVNPLRGIASLKRTTSNNYKGVSAAQISASFDAEGSVVSDDSPTLVGTTINVCMARAYVQASFEAFEDVTDMAQEIQGMFADAKETLEGQVFATGTGTNEPWGIVTRVTGVTASRVTPTTGGTFVLADLYKLQNALPARHSPGAAWVGSLTAINLARRFGEGTTGSNSAFWSDLGSDVPPQLLGRPIYEYSAMSTSVTTGQNLLLYGDFRKYWIVDHVRGTMIEQVPIVFDQATGRPNGTRGMLLTWRVGADAIDADAFRILKL
jgi:HK97 family phage major capsid protein